MFGNYIEYEQFVIKLPIKIASKDSCINTIFLDQRNNDHKDTIISIMLTDEITSYYEAQTGSQLPLQDILDKMAMTQYISGVSSYN